MLNHWNESTAVESMIELCNENNILNTMLQSNALLEQTVHYMFWSPQHLVKDDVFFGPVHIQDQSVTIPTPCLSPVTSPSDVLYDPPASLFDMDMPLLDQKIDEPITKVKSFKIITLDKKSKSLTKKSNHSKKTSLLDSSPHHKKKLKLFYSKKSTLFQKLTESGIDWCRYCGTTEGVNWRPGPWGKRTLCNKHGCDYKGYGLASRLPRLDLSNFIKEKLEDRQRPIVQEFCVICQLPEQENNKLIACDGGCCRAYHENCYSIPKKSNSFWYCSHQCQENKEKNKVVVDLPRKYLPLMKLQKKTNSTYLTKNNDKNKIYKKKSVCLLY